MSVTCGCCKAPATNYHQRVLYHSKRFQGKDQQDVLQRYDTRRHKMSLSQLQRCTFHISSWIAKLPASKMIKRHKGLSAVILLRRYLQSLSKLGEQRLCPQLSKLLTTVFWRLNAHLDDVQWMRLKTVLMPLLPKIQASSVEPKTLEGEDDTILSDGVWGHTNAIQVWRNQISKEAQEIYVTDLERSLHEDSSESKLHDIFCAAVAALSPPRLLPMCEYGSNTEGPKEMEDYGGNAVQQRLRKVVLGCLEKLQLEDPKIQTSLQFLEILLQEVSELANKGLLAAHRDWLNLQMKCGMLKEKCIEVSENKRLTALEKRCEHGIRRGDRGECKQCRPCPHGNSRYHCKQCRPCPHGKVRKDCAICAGCPHGKLKQNCGKCRPCPHGKLRQNCKNCSGCPHGKLKFDCRFCYSCAHGRLKRRCTLCRENRELPRSLVLFNAM